MPEHDENEEAVRHASRRGWHLERVVEMTENHLRLKEDAEFEEAFAEAGC